MTVTTPIPVRNIQVNPLRDAEIFAIVNEYATWATTNSDPMAHTFAVALYNYLVNHRSATNELSQWASKVNGLYVPKLALDEYGNPSQVLDTL